MALPNTSANTPEIEGMQSQPLHPAHPDFVLFPPGSHKQLKMLALESSRQQQFPYFQSYTMDPALIDPFAFPVDPLGGYGQNQDPSGLQSYYDGSDMSKTSGFPSTTPPLMTTSQPAEHAMPGLSSASGPSIASASSSAIGSPYSGNVQTFQESWVDTSHGLGLQGAVVGDLFPNDYVGGTVDPEGFYQKKSQNSYVGELQDISSSVQSTVRVSASHECPPPCRVVPSEENVKPSFRNSLRATAGAPVPVSSDSSGISMTPVSHSVASPSSGAPLFASPSTPASARISTPSIKSPNVDYRQPGLCSKTASFESSTFSPNAGPSISSSSFFQQSSGNFVPPLESSCRFSFSYP